MKQEFGGSMMELVVSAMVDAAVEEIDMPHVLIVTRGDGSQLHFGPFANGYAALDAAVETERELATKTAGFPGLDWTVRLAPLQAHIDRAH